MARRTRVSFLAKKLVKKRVSFDTWEGRVSFTAKRPKRKRVTFYANE